MELIEPPGSDDAGVKTRDDGMLPVSRRYREKLRRVGSSVFYKTLKKTSIPSAFHLKMPTNRALSDLNLSPSRLFLHKWRRRCERCSGHGNHTAAWQDLRCGHDGGGGNGLLGARLFGGRRRSHQSSWPRSG
ncbi:MAG: hypothetical protein H7232_07295 [Aeromicrobium sp.]|nr:hypothetical protein [Burkholderiales bacterium]